MTGDLAYPVIVYLAYQSIADVSSQVHRQADFESECFHVNILGGGGGWGCHIDLLFKAFFSFFLSPILPRLAGR